MTFDAIAEWLNNEGQLTLRGKQFRGAHVHSSAVQSYDNPDHYREVT